MNAQGIYGWDPVARRLADLSIATLGRTARKRVGAGIVFFGLACLSAFGDGPTFFRKGPYLIYPGQSNAMTVAFQTTRRPAQAFVEWGLTEKHETGRVTLKQIDGGVNGHRFFYALTNLPGDTQIHYRAVVDGESHTGSFRTPPPLTAPQLTFYAFGDTRAGLPVEDKIAGRLLVDLRAKPETRETFLLHTGDYVLCGLAEDYWDTEMFTPKAQSLRLLLARLPLLGAVGNHEGYDRRHLVEGGKTLNLGRIGLLFRKYFPYPMYVEPKRFYYSFDYGLLHVAVLDTWSYSGLYTHEHPDSAQRAWLEHDLATTKCPWKVILIHTPVYDWNSRDAWLQSELAPVFERAGVQLVIQGHEHYYAHLEVKGIQYLVLGGGGATLTKFRPVSMAPAGSVRFKAAVHHFGRFEISGNEMKASIFDPKGALVEPAFTIPIRQLR
jgi:acid phosphatase type 7